MRNSLGQRTHVRQRIVESATQLFNRHGFASVSIDEIMAGAGLTRGGFYNYFQSKAELYAEAVTFFGKDKPVANGAGQARDHAAWIVRAYLSRPHLESAEASCPLIGLPNDPSKKRSVGERGAGSRRQDNGRNLRAWRCLRSQTDQATGTGACLALRGRHGAGAHDRRPFACR